MLLRRQTRMHFFICLYNNVSISRTTSSARKNWNSNLESVKSGYSMAEVVSWFTIKCLPCIYRIWVCFPKEEASNFHWHVGKVKMRDTSTAFEGSVCRVSGWDFKSRLIMAQDSRALTKSEDDHHVCSAYLYTHHMRQRQRKLPHIHEYIRWYVIMCAHNFRIEMCSEKRKQRTEED
jgi:hypothetical protein